MAEARVKEQVTTEDTQATRARGESGRRGGSAGGSRRRKRRTSEAERGTARSTQAIRRVEEFIRDHDAGRAQRLHRLGELPALIAAAEEDRAAALAEQDALTVEESTDATVRAEETVKRDGMATERGQIEYYDRRYDAGMREGASVRPGHPAWPIQGCRLDLSQQGGGRTGQTPRKASERAGQEDREGRPIRQARQGCDGR